MLLVQKLLNHPVFTLPAWQLEGGQTLLQFFICTQFRFGTSDGVCVCVCVCVCVSSLLCLPYRSYSLLLCLTLLISPAFLPPFVCPLPSFLTFLFHLWFRRRFPRLSFIFVFWNSLPPLTTSSSLALPRFVSYFISFPLNQVCFLPDSVRWLLVRPGRGVTEFTVL